MPQTLPDRLFDRAAEAAVLGAMVVDHKCIPSVLERLDRESFALTEHKTILDAIVSVWRRNPGGEIDGLLLRSELSNRKELEEAGGLDYLREVVETVPSSVNVLYYARLVADKKRFRDAAVALGKMQEVLDGPGDINGVIQEIQGLAMGLECRARDQNVYHVKDHATIVAIQTQDAPCIVPTGFIHVDRLAGGVCPGDLAYLAARPSMGKTAFACGWALNAARTGTHVALFTLEMTARAVMERLSATLGQVPLARIKRPNPPKDMLDQFYDGSLRLAELPITIVENIPTVGQIMATLRQLKQMGSVGLVMIDYVGLMAASDSRTRNRNEQVSEISRELKRMAQMEHVPVVALSQLNRECEARDSHRPRMSDLRDSGSQEQDADLVMLLHREDYYRKMADPEAAKIDGLADVLVAKARNGPTGLAQLVFIEEEMRFADLAAEFNS
jgi:replicative DNA helicase